MIRFALILGLFAATAQPGAKDFPLGIVVPRVECAAVPGQSYALFLPPGYSRDRAWPILYLFDAGARGPLAARIFSEGAARYGWIIASSNNTRSDGPVDPNITALRAMWNDSHERFSLDPRRAYAGGFSGGARVATLMASTAPGTVAGVIGCGAGFYRPVTAKPPFVYFGTVGNLDFNFTEMRALDDTLTSLAAPHRIVRFEGEHDWPPKEICLDALEWMEIQAVRTGASRVTGGELDSIFAKRCDRARALESEHPAEALAEYRSIEADFSGLRDVSVAHAATERLERSPEARRAISEEKKQVVEEDRTRAAQTAVWAEIRSGEAIPQKRLVQELRIPELREKAARVPVSEESLSAKRVLNEIAAQTSFYLARGYRGEKKLDRELLCLSIAIEAKPDSPAVWYRRAAALAAAGERARALEDLSRSVEKGFAMPESLETDEDLASIRSSDRFAALLAAVRARAEAKPGS